MSRTGTWTHHCEEEFEHLAVHDPAKLLGLLSGGDLRPTLLTFAAEIAGSVGPSHAPEAFRALDALSNHPLPYVREGCVYGLGRLGTTIPAATDLIARLASPQEPSEGVRAAAQSVLGLEAPCARTGAPDRRPA